MSNIVAGMLAKSLAGHDENSIYYINSVDTEYVYLVDGRLRKLSNPKRKKKKHIQVIKTIYNIEETGNDVTRNNEIKKLIKQYKNEHSI